LLIKSPLLSSLLNPVPIGLKGLHQFLYWSLLTTILSTSSTKQTYHLIPSPPLNHKHMTWQTTNIRCDKPQIHHVCQSPSLPANYWHVTWQTTSTWVKYHLFLHHFSIPSGLHSDATDMSLNEWQCHSHMTELDKFVKTPFTGLTMINIMEHCTEQWTKLQRQNCYKMSLHKSYFTRKLWQYTFSSKMLSSVAHGQYRLTNRMNNINMHFLYIIQNINFTHSKNVSPIHESFDTSVLLKHDFLFCIIT
jgi:hypothetical protein